MSTAPVFLSPATPSELAIYVSSQCVHPTTLVICTTQQEFDFALNEDISREMRQHNPGYPQDQDDEQQEPDHDDAREPSAAIDEDLDMSVMPELPDRPPAWISPLLQHSIHRVAIAKHIRVVFVPSVSHLRAWLTVFPPADPNAVEPPPASAANTFARKTETVPLLLLYGFLDLHRDTSEWSAQGLSSSAATLVEAAHQAGLRSVVVEPRMDWDEQVRDSEAVLGEEMPMLSGAERRAAGRDQDEGGGGWIGRTVPVRRVLSRWFRFEEGPWDVLKEVQGDDETQ
ncbi:hypothetical protein CONLIGDRAFT_632878 [Coniochaeta ligniaria NRRL 30616]|uniref:Uncharacterized protein n=1 Tax=Coniochaeta ligniaria NRRL 30616 TaxID=1408157 RepID=A0A1J7IN26_9PEZI|nr:hypothetical protein CONLIGDRAFT_632878 [Coniochaeta ligniaria NRRL 30616]